MATAQGVSQSTLGHIDRPVTASSQGTKIRELQEEVKREQKDKKKLLDQIDSLKNEIQK
jgi:hypothetical protein